MLVPLSKVDHLGSRTLNHKPVTERNDLMWAKLELYNKKYNENLFIEHPMFLKWKRLQSV
jgi:hypothetical protein